MPHYQTFLMVHPDFFPSSPSSPEENYVYDDHDLYGYSLGVLQGQGRTPLGDSRGEPVGVPGNARNRRNLGMFIPLKWWLGGWFLALGVSHVIICYNRLYTLKFKSFVLFELHGTTINLPMNHECCWFLVCKYSRGAVWNCASGSFGAAERFKPRPDATDIMDQIYWTPKTGQPGLVYTCLLYHIFILYGL